MKTLSLLVVAAASCQGASLSQFVPCLGAQGQGPVCQLDARTYPIASTQGIARSNLTIKGTSSRRPTKITASGIAIYMPAPRRNW